MISDTRDEDAVRLQVLIVLQDARAGHTLAELRLLLHLTHRAAALLRVLGSLVSDGLVEKRHDTLMSSWSDQWERRPVDRGYHAVRFSLTPAGQVACDVSQTAVLPGHEARSAAARGAAAVIASIAAGGSVEHELAAHSHLQAVVPSPAAAAPPADAINDPLDDRQKDFEWDDLVVEPELAPIQEPTPVGAISALS